MKNYILFLILITASFTINAQTTWTGAGGDTNWSTIGNWNNQTVPTAVHDVVIPTGFTVTLNVTGNVKSINLQGNAVLEINANLTFTEPSTFDVNTTINWSVGFINGNTSSLTNMGTINLIATSLKTINGGTILENQGVLNITASGDLVMNQGSIINNPVGGIIDMQADTGNIRWFSGEVCVLNNAGLIKKTTSSGEAQLSLLVNNNDGTIQVEVGVLSFQGGTEKNLTDGTYNVFSGATMDWDTTINPSGTLEGTIVGDLNWIDDVNIPEGETATFNFSETDNFNWTTGTLTGGGTLINTNVLKLTGTSIHNINGETTLENQGILNITTSGDLVMNQGSIINNPVGGIIDMQADTGNIRWFSGVVCVLNNAGLIKKTTSSGEAQLSLLVNNDDGTIQVEVGVLSFQGGSQKNLTDGTYNVFAGATMDWDTTISPSGTLEGTIDGDLNWIDDVNIPVGETATFNFSETDNFNWTSGTLIGGGTLINTNVLKLRGTSVHNINEGTTLENQGILNITSIANLVLNQGSIINNLVGGTIDMQADSGNIRWFSGAVCVLNNAGLIKRSTTTGVAQLSLELNNSGTISVESGELEITGSLPFTNEVSGIVKGIGIFDLPLVANYNNNGTFAPGLSPGTLSVQGEYTSTATSVLDIELDGLAPDSEYDVLAITGTNVVLDGSVNITLGFEPALNDEFIIATITGTISVCDIANTASADFNGNTYTFDVFCRNDNELVLGVDNITLGLGEVELKETVSLYPNPIKNEFHIKTNTLTVGSWLIYNELGQKMMHGQLQGLETKINTESLISGFYILHIKDENNRSITAKKIIKS